MALTIDIKEVGQAQVVQLAGDIDGATAPQAQSAILGLAAPDCRIVVDMSGVTYMSSAGLRLLLVIYRTVMGQGGQILLAGLPEDLKDTMEMTGFLDFFQYRDTLDAALAALI